MNAHAVDWQDEARRYEQPHPRLRQVADLIRALHPRRMLDVGCATAALRTLLPPEIAYCGCDVTDHAAAVLPAGDFLQVDFNRTFDLSAFEGKGIDLVHIGGVLEYLDNPGVLLRAVRGLAATGMPLIVTIINFGAARYRAPATHHPGWVYKPSDNELRSLLSDAGWSVAQIWPVFSSGWPSPLVGAALSRTLGSDHWLTRRRAEQFIVVARAT